MIRENNFVSISDLRDHTSQIMKDISRDGTKIILSQNKPIGVFLSIEQYNAMKKVAFERENATYEDIHAYQKSSHGQDGVEAFSFLKSLQ